MSNRSARTTLALSAALALTVALAPAATFAKGPGNGNCDGECTADQPQSQQQTRARDGSGEGSSSGSQPNPGRQAATKANAGGGGQVQGRVGNGGRADKDQVTNGRNARQNQNAQQNAQQKAKVGAGQGPNYDGERGPGTCDGCDAEMGELTDEQIAGVLFMANEEKLAHDVYAFFAEQYGVPIFANIAESEARHQEAVNVVLERYGLADAAIEPLAGVFSNEEIAALYDKLIAQGSASLEEAIAVGILIEELDIADLQTRMASLELAESEDFAADVHEMYSHLLAGSQNHLAAFEGWL